MFQQFLTRIASWFAGTKTKVETEVKQVEDRVKARYEDMTKVHYDTPTSAPVIAAPAVIEPVPEPVVEPTVIEPEPQVIEVVDVAPVVKARKKAVTTAVEKKPAAKKPAVKKAALK
jgi:hypothetical protein